MPIDRESVERLMKRCQIGVGGRNALDTAHDIMAECYGTLGALREEVERLRNECNRRSLMPTSEMIEAGAQRLVQWDGDGCTWPDSWEPLIVAQARNEAERVWRSMWVEAMRDRPNAKHEPGP